MKPIWENYRKWECYRNKMYDTSCNKENIKLCKIILTNDNLKNNMSETTKQYKVSTKVNLTNKMFNPISWLGQATCNRLIGASAKETCQAWLTMTEDEQKKANNMAKEVIEEWRKSNENI